jgi:hypothetical protein
MPLQRLEPYGSKDPRPVLRGLSAGNCAQLPYFDYGTLGKAILIILAILHHESEQS